MVSGLTAKESGSCSLISSSGSRISRRFLVYNSKRQRLGERQSARQEKITFFLVRPLPLQAAGLCQRRRPRLKERKNFGFPARKKARSITWEELAKSQKCLTA